MNSCRFNSYDHELMLTSGGDHEVHIWKWSSEDNRDDDEEENDLTTQILRNPILVFRGEEVVSCADWLQRDQIVSASWDRSATLWQVCQSFHSFNRTLFNEFRWKQELLFVLCMDTMEN